MAGATWTGPDLWRASGSPRSWAAPSLAALIAASGLLAFYLGLVAWAQGWEHAWSLLREDLWFVAPITAGFAVQVGLFVYLRGLHAASTTGAAVTTGSAGTSGGAMLACCAHHLTDVLPFLGISGAAIFLNEIKTPLALIGLGMNAFGVGFLTLRIRRFRRAARTGNGDPGRAAAVRRPNGASCH